MLFKRLLAVSLIVFGFISFSIKIQYPLAYKEVIEETFDPPLIYAIVKTESSFRPNAESRVGAKGLMQIMPSTEEYVCRMYGIQKKDLFEPSYNIEIGSKYLAYLLQKFKDFDTAIMAYNAGEGFVRTWLKDLRFSNDGKCLRKTPFDETNQYLKKVQKNLKIYKKMCCKRLTFPAIYYKITMLSDEGNENKINAVMAELADAQD